VALELASALLCPEIADHVPVVGEFIPQAAQHFALAVIHRGAEFVDDRHASSASPLAEPSRLPVLCQYEPSLGHGYPNYKPKSTTGWRVGVTRDVRESPGRCCPEPSQLADDSACGLLGVFVFPDPEDGPALCLEAASGVSVPASVPREFRGPKLRIRLGL